MLPVSVIGTPVSGTHRGLVLPVQCVVTLVKTCVASD